MTSREPKPLNATASPRGVVLKAQGDFNSSWCSKEITGSERYNYSPFLLRISTSTVRKMGRWSWRQSDQWGIPKKIVALQNTSTVRSTGIALVILELTNSIERFSRIERISTQIRSIQVKITYNTIKARHKRRIKCSKVRRKESTYQVLRACRCKAPSAWEIRDDENEHEQEEVRRASTDSAEHWRRGPG